MTTTTAPLDACTERMHGLVDELRRVVGRALPPELTVRLVAAALAPHLGSPDLLTPAQQEGDPERYRQHLLHAESDGSLSVAALVWLPGQHTSIHDHVSWCTTGVHRGEESERRYLLVPDGRTGRLVATEDVVNRQGEVCGFTPPGDIHRVANTGPGTAISLHVYGADLARLGSSVRRVYQHPVEG
ncbi:cysteine dioxygenase [Kitasatospora sp. NPDC001664]